MGDRGLTTTESVGLKQAKVLRVSVSMWIGSGLLRHKYTILESTVPTDFLSCNPNGALHSQIPMIYHLVRVCSAPVKLCPAIVPFNLFCVFFQFQKISTPNPWIVIESSKRVGSQNF